MPAFLAADLPFAVHLAFSYDEEVGGFGARRLIADLRERGVAPLACIVGEPTGMVPALAHKGVYRWRCCVSGHAAHSSLTPQSVNAIEVGARVVGKLADMAARWRDEEPRYEGFDVPYSTGSVGVIEGGIADNVVPEDCRFHYEFRNLPGSRRRRDAGRGARLRASRSSRRCARSRPTPASASRRSARCRRSWRAPTIRPCCSRGASPQADATTLVAFGTEAGLFQRAGIADRRLRPGPHRAGAPGRRVRVARPARRAPSASCSR